MNCDFCSLFAQYGKLALQACGPLGVAACQHVYRESKSNAAPGPWHRQVCSAALLRSLTVMCLFSANHSLKILF